jgi:hypothetical protein
VFSVGFTKLRTKDRHDPSGVGMKLERRIKLILEGAGVHTGGYGMSESFGFEGGCFDRARCGVDGRRGISWGRWNCRFAIATPW